MQVHKTYTRITRWEITNDKFSFPLSCLEKQQLALSFPDNEIETENKHIALIVLNVYMTNMDTDFILDAFTETIILFDINDMFPSKQCVYKLYCIANEESNKIVEKRAKQFLAEIDTHWDCASYEIVEPIIIEAIKSMSF